VITLMERTVRSATRPRDTHVTAVLTAAALLAAVAFIHLADQGFFAFHKSPGYLQIAYLAVEIAAPVVALALLRRPSIAAWLLTAGCAVGPLVGFVLTRSTGLPNAREDIGNWGETLGVSSVIVEATLLLVAVVELLRLRRPGSALDG
jgi:hypothetical protein